MKKLYALCLLALAAVVADVFLFHVAPVGAQTQSAVGKVNIRQVNPDSREAVNVTDAKFLGFSCVVDTAARVCFIVTGN